MRGYVYVQKNNINDMVYIGSTVQRLTTRFNKQCKDNANPTDTSKYAVAMRQLGPENFWIEVLEEVEVANRRELLTHEFRWIATYPEKMLYNTDLELGKRSATTISKVSAAKTGKTRSQAERKTMSKVFTQRGNIWHHVKKRTFLFRWYPAFDKDRQDESFAYGPNSPWDQEEAYFYAQQFRNKIFGPPPVTSDDIANQYKPDQGRFVQVPDDKLDAWLLAQE